MEFIILISFIPEIYLSLSIFILLLFNVMVLNISKLNYQVLKVEIFSQVMTVLVCLFLLVFFVWFSGAEQDTFTLLVQCKVIWAMPVFPPKTKNIVKLWFHGSVRSKKVQTSLLVFLLVIAHYLSFGLIWSWEPLIILGVFLGLFSLEFLIKFYALRLGQFSKTSLYNLLVFGLTFLILLGLTKQLYQLIVYFTFLFILSFFNLKLRAVKFAYTNSDFLANILKTDVEAMQIINLHLYCDLPRLQIFFDHSFRGVVFLWSILFSPTMRDCLGISSSGQLYSLYLIVFFFQFKYFIYIYLQFGCNSNIVEILPYGRRCIASSVKYVGPTVLGFAGYTFDSPHKAVDLFSESTVGDFQNILGVHPNTNSSHASAIDQVHYMRASGVKIDFDHLRDPENPKFYNVGSIEKGKQLFDSGAPASEVQRSLYAESVSKSGVNTVSVADKHMFKMKTKGLTEGSGSSAMDDYFLKGKK